MSQYLSFELINKSNPDIKVDLGHWCTSIARGISYNFENIFNYTENNVTLDIDTLKSYIEILHEGIEKYKTYLREEQDSKQENTNLLLKAQTKVAVDAIREYININEESIKEWEDEVETWSLVETKLNFILNILEENKEQWYLIYNNS